MKYLSILLILGISSCCSQPVAPEGPKIRDVPAYIWNSMPEEAQDFWETYSLEWEYYYDRVEAACRY